MSDNASQHAGLAPNNNNTPSDLAQAAAGLLSVGKFTSGNCSHSQTAPRVSPSGESNTIKTPQAVTTANLAATTDNLSSAAVRAAGLRSLQAVESLLRSQQGKCIPANPLTGIVGDKVTAEEYQAWKRARSCVYTARNRSKKVEQIKVLEEGIEFFKRQLGIGSESKVDEQQDSSLDTKKPPSKLKGVKRKVYLPPEEQMSKMTEEEISEWKRKERLKRKREANAASVKEQQDRILQLAIEHEMLHEKYKAKCNGSGSVQQILSDHGQDVERDSHILKRQDKSG